MQFYKVWYKDKEKGTNFLVSAEDTQEARQLVTDHLNRIANFHEPSLFDIGYATQEDSDWITIWKKESSSWGHIKVQTTAWKEWQCCKADGARKVIAEYNP